jgi:hypothetical protein
MIKQSSLAIFLNGQFIEAPFILTAGIMRILLVDYLTKLHMHLPRVRILVHLFFCYYY